MRDIKIYYASFFVLLGELGSMTHASFSFSCIFAVVVEHARCHGYGSSEEVEEPQFECGELEIL
jgi:hypothetical protein